MASLTCSSCNALLKSGAKFCPRCGRAVGNPKGPLHETSSGLGGITCPKCGAQNRVGAKFCSKCRVSLGAGMQNRKGLADPSGLGAVKCPQCGAANRVGAKFCANCRSDLPQGARAPIIYRGAEKGSARSKWLIPAFASAVVMLVCALVSIVAWISANNQTEIASASPTATINTPLAPGSVTLVPEATPAPVIAMTWQTFAGAGYSLRYPPGWYVYQAKTNEKSGMRYDLILSNAPNNTSSQSATPDESARVTVSYLPRAAQPLGEWVMQRWAWLDAPLDAATIDDAPAFSARAFFSAPSSVQEFFWIEHRGQYYIVNAYARGDAPDALDHIQRVMASFKLIK